MSGSVTGPVSTTWTQRLAALAAGPIDVHTHAIDPQLPDIGARYPGSYPTVVRDGAQAATIMLGEQVYRRIDERSWSVSARLRDMDAENVAVQVLSPIPVTLCHGEPAAGASALARAQNDYLAGLAAQAPDRFLALGAVPLQDPEQAVAELHRCVDELGMPGVEVGSRIGDLDLSDEAFRPFFDAASDLGAVVLVHPVDRTLDPRLARLGIGFGLGMPTETATAAAALLVAGTLERAPGAHIVLAHGGGALPAILPRLARGQVIADAAIPDADLVTNRARRLWCDSLTYDVIALEHAIARFGAEHVVLGSDYPFSARETPPGAVFADLDRPRRDALARGNAEALLAAVNATAERQLT